MNQPDSHIKYVKCCIDEYFEHYTYSTASNSKTQSGRRKTEREKTIWSCINASGFIRFSRCVSSRCVCPSADAPPLVSDPLSLTAGVLEAQMSHRVHLRGPIKLENISPAKKKTKKRVVTLTGMYFYGMFQTQAKLRLQIKIKVLSGFCRMQDRENMILLLLDLLTLQCSLKTGDLE